MEAKVTREERGGLPIAPSTQGLGGKMDGTEREHARERLGMGEYAGMVKNTRVQVSMSLSEAKAVCKRLPNNQVILYDCGTGLKLKYV